MYPLISVIVNCHNGAKYLKTCIKSILNQKYKNFEIIIVYDDEDQADLSTIKQVVINQSKIKLIINKKNIGAGLSRNIGILNANGDYVAFIDSDDYWNKEKLEVQLNIMLTQKKDFTHTSYQIVDEMGNFKGYRKAKNFNNLKSTYYEIKSRETNIMVITNSYNVIHELNIEKNNYIMLHKLNYYNEILFAIALQKLAYVISIGKGINPDKPRNLAKVVTVE